MKIWIHTNGVQQGPFEIEQLPIERMTPQTPVWHEGLKDWVPAFMVPEIMAAFNPAAQPRQTESADTSAGQGYTPYTDISGNAGGVDSATQHPHGSRPSYGGAAGNTVSGVTGQPECPSSYLLWSVLLTVLCCNPIGIIPIFTGASVKSRYRNFDYEGAARKSETTAWWLMITIVTSLILACVTPLLYL